jgi:tetratricopeptide (TPR) repeat protein
MLRLPFLFLILFRWTGTAQLSYSDYMRLGAQSMNQGEPATAVAAFQSAVSIDSQSVMAWMHLANARMGLYLWLQEATAVKEAIGGQAAHAWQEAIQRDPGNEVALWGLAVTYAMTEKPDKAREAAAKLLDVFPNSRDGHYMMGFLDWAASRRSGEKLERLKAALRSFEKAARIDPEFTNAMVSAALVARNLQLESAEEWNLRAEKAHARAKEAPAAKVDPNLPPPAYPVLGMP